MLNGNIYRLTSPAGKCYIGQTIHLKRRINNYSKLNCEKQWKLLRALKKYGFENFKIDILFQYNSENRDRLNILLDAMEKFCIKKYDSVYNGYNIRFGGAGGKCTEETLEKMRFAQSNRSEETRRKMSEWQKGKRLPDIAYEKSKATNTGRPMPQHVKDATRKSNIGRVMTQENRNKISLANLGKKMSDETKLKLSIANTGRKHTEAAIRKISIASQNMSDESKEKMKVSRALGKDKNTKVRKEMNNGSWFSDAGREIVRNAALIGMGVVRLDLNGNYIDEFISINEAKRTCHVHQDIIRKSIQGKYIRDNRFKWIKKNDYYNTNKNIENNEYSS